MATIKRPSGRTTIPSGPASPLSRVVTEPSALTRLTVPLNASLNNKFPCWSNVRSSGRPTPRKMTREVYCTGAGFAVLVGLGTHAVGDGETLPEVAVALDIFAAGGDDAAHEDISSSNTRVL